jgi:hypothetical protein
MILSEEIQERLQKLPAPYQAEVLNFVEYLLAKAEHETVQEERWLWSDLSLSSAMRGMEEENTPLYTPDDLKIVSL